MPKDTYLNLPQEKKDLIFTIALEEFSKYPYRDASLSRIVERAGIAKGSMYQYFENKKDLYFYIIETLGNIKLSYMNKYSDFKNKDFFETILEILLMGTRFTIEHPQYHSLLERVFNGNNDPFESEAILKMKKMSEQWLREIVCKAQERGEVRRDIDTDLITYLLQEIFINLGDYLMKRHGLSYDQLLNRKSSIQEEEIKKVSKDLINLLRLGVEDRA